VLLAVAPLAYGQVQPSKVYIRLGNRVIAIENLGAPTITTLSPASASAGANAFILTVNGTGFTASSVVQWNGSARTTTFVSATQLTAAILASDVTSPGPIPVTVVNPGGATSQLAAFTVNQPTPVITSLSPSGTAPGSSAITLGVTGTNFVANSVVQWNGSPRNTTFVSSTFLNAQILASDLATAGSAVVTVMNPPPGGGSSNAVSFSLTDPIPTATSLSPNGVPAGAPAFTLTVNGANFVHNSVVQWNGSARTTTFVNSTQLTASVSASDVAVAGSAGVTVVNPAPGGGTTSHLTFNITSPPPGYLYSALITVHHNLVSGGSNLSNFPLLIYNVYPFLKTIANSGNIANTTTLYTHGPTVPTDLIFTSDSAGTQLLSWEVVEYDPTSGALQAWVKIPTLYYSQDTMIYMFYGNSAVTTYQSTYASAWDSTFVDVYHLESLVPGAAVDSTGNNTLGQYNPGYDPTVVPGEIGNAFYYQKLHEENDGAGGTSNLPTNTSARTLETWFKLDPGQAGTLQYLGGWGGQLSNQINGSRWTLIYGGNNTLGVEINGGGASIPWTFDTNWHHLAATSAAGNSNPQNANLYLDGTLVPISTYSGSIATTSNFLILGGSPDVGYGDLTGTLDEFRISSIDRSAGWIATEYNNATSLNSFYTLVVVPNPLPSVSSLAPASVTAGAPGFTLTVNGTGFVSTSTVQWNGSPRATTFVSAMQLSAAISAYDLATAAGTATVTVSSPTPGGGTSSGATFTVVSPGTAGYAYNSAVTIYGSQVAGTELNFPMLITGTYPLLATSANGGLIQNTTVLNTQTVPADLVFTSDAAGANLLSWEVASYTPTSGQIEIWVRIPNLSTGNNTTIYMWYGNAAVTTYQCTASTTWDPYYSAVYHFGNVNSLSLVDSTINNNSLANAEAAATAGQIGGAISAAGASGAATGLPGGSSPRTLEAWVSSANNPPIGSLLQSGLSLGLTFPPLAAGVQVYSGNTTGSALVPYTVGGGSWRHLVGELPSGNTVSSIQVYLDSVLQTPTYTNGSIAVNTLSVAGINASGVDEARISTIARTSDWITTEYGNQRFPTTFYNLSLPTAPAITGISPALAFVGASVTISGLNFGATQGNSTLTFNGTNGRVAATPTSWSATSIVAVVPVGAMTGNVVVTVNNVASNGKLFTVTLANPSPVLASLSPSSDPAGTAGLTLTLTGTGFLSSSQAQWNGSNRTTSYVSATQLTMFVTSADFYIPGTATVTVLNPAPGGGASNSLPFTIGASPDPVSCTVVSGTGSASCGSRGLSTLRATFDGSKLLDTVSWVTNPPDDASNNCADGPCYFNEDYFTPLQPVLYPGFGYGPGGANGTGFSLGEVASYLNDFLYTVNSFLGLPSGANNTKNLLTTVGQGVQGLALTFDTSSTNSPNTNAGVYGVGFDFQLSTACNSGSGTCPAQPTSYSVTFQVYGTTPGCTSSVYNYDLATNIDNYAVIDCFDYATGVPTSAGSTSGTFSQTGSTGVITSGADGGTGAGPLLATVTMNSANGAAGFFGITTTSPIGAIYASAASTSDSATGGAFAIDNVDLLGATTTGSGYQLTIAASPSAGGTVTPASASYVAGTVVNVSAIPNLGYQFVNWSGPVANPNAAYTSVTMNAPESVTANFQATATTSITVTTSPSGISFAVDGTTYTSAQTFTWLVGSLHTIATTSPQPGGTGMQYAFSSWSDNPANAALSHTVTTPQSPTTYTASFITQYQLTTAASPSADGTVTPASGAYYNAGTVIGVTALPNSGYSLLNWSGPVANPTALGTSVTMSAPVSVTANFQSATITSITVTTVPAGLSFTVDNTTYTAAQTFNWFAGSSHTIATSSQTGANGTPYTFYNWSDSGAISHTVTAPSSTASFIASFTTQYQFTISPSTLTFSVDSVSCTGSQTFTWVVGSNHNLSTTSPQAGAVGTQYVFNNWSDGGAMSRIVTAGSTTTYAATFTTQYFLTALASPPAAGSVYQSTNGWYPAGSQPFIDTITNAGYLFVSWTGPVLVSSLGAGAVNMNGPVTVTANFAAITASVVESYTGVGTAPTYTVDGGDPQYRSQAFAWPVGSSHTLATVTPQLYQIRKTVYGGYQYVFDNWSDGGAATHTIVVPPTPTTYTVTFDLQCQLTIAASSSAEGSVTPGTGSWYNQGTVVNITATPAAGYQFVSWTGSVANSTSATTTVTMSTPQTVTANFAPSEDVEFANLLARVSKDWSLATAQ
jgi:hypothetical protein